jgi:hypothetical protein
MNLAAYYILTVSTSGPCKKHTPIFPKFVKKSRDYLISSVAIRLVTGCFYYTNGDANTFIVFSASEWQEMNHSTI